MVAEMVSSATAMAARFKINQYNWFGQKLLVQHRYDNLLKLRQYLSSYSINSAASESIALIRPISDHLNYLNGLALMKTSNRLDELIFTLQQLNFQKNQHYFLSLCQCLMYLGNFDSVIALCKQLFNKEIQSQTDRSEDLAVEDDGEQQQQEPLKEGPTGRHTKPPSADWCLQSIDDNGGSQLEFQRIIKQIAQNNLINEPRLWFIFALSLELQRQFKDAEIAYRVASRLASPCWSAARAASTDLATAANSSATRATSPIESTARQDRHKDHSTHSMAVGQTTAIMSNYHKPHCYYAEFCVRHKGDYRQAIQVLHHQAAGRSAPLDRVVSPFLALLLTVQPSAGSSHFNRSIELLSSLDSHLHANKNPSFCYNLLALKCKQRLRLASTSQTATTPLLPGDQLVDVMEDYDDSISANCLSLDYALIKSHIVLNNLVQQAAKLDIMFKCSLPQPQPQPQPKQQQQMAQSTSEDEQVNKQIDRLIDTLRCCHVGYWSSGSLWNNLGICYLIKRRFIAALSCLMKAQQASPLDWRINFNLGLLFVHVGLYQRALGCLMASRSFLPNNFRPITSNSNSSNNSRQQLAHSGCNSHWLISTLMAICYDELGELSESRRLYVETTRKVPNGSQSASVLSLVNYIVFLAKINQPHDEQATRQGMTNTTTNTKEHQEASNQQQDAAKLIGRLLDQLEQAWLQRNQNQDSQFNIQLMEAARQAGELSLRRRGHLLSVATGAERSYAWTKCDQLHNNTK